MHYAAFGGLRTATDANNRTTTFVLDGLNRKTSANYPGGFTGTWAYDGEGLLLSQTNKRGVTSLMTYDNQGRELTASAQGLSEPFQCSPFPTTTQIARKRAPTRITIRAFTPMTACGE